MSKKRKLIVVVFLCFLLVTLIAGNTFAQQLPDEINAQNDALEEAFSEGDVATLNIPADPDVVRIETMMSEEESKESIPLAFDRLDVEGAQDIIDVYMQYGYSLSDIAAILKSADFSLEDVFKAMLNKLGDDALQEIVGALLEGNFNAGDVFKASINHLKQVNPDLTDEQIIETILGEEVDPLLFKSLLQEIFINKISSVSYPIKRDLVMAMVEAGFTFEEITAALSENGFNLEQIAKIYSLGDIYIGLIYDLLINAQGGQEIADVLEALLASSYSTTVVLECIINKLSGTHSVEEIVAIVMGEVAAEGPTSDQLNNAIVLAGVFRDNGTSIPEICEAFLSAGFNLENTAAVLNGIGIGLEDAFSTLLNSQGGQNVADVALALINNGYDVHAVFTLSVEEFKNQGVGLDEIVSLLIGEIDPESGPTKEQMENALLLVNVLINAEDSLEAIAGTFIAHEFGLENTADLLKDNDVALVDTYNALVGALGGEQASVAVAMTDVGFSINEVIELAVRDLKDQGFNTAEIVSMLIENVEEDKNPNSKQLNRAYSLTQLLVAQGDSLQEIGDALFDIGFDLKYVSRVFKKTDITITDAFVVIINIDGGQEYYNVCADMNAGGYTGTDVFETAVTELKNQEYTISEIINILIGTIDPEEGASRTQLNNARDLTKYLINSGESLQEICEVFFSMDLSLEDIATVMRRSRVKLEDIFSTMLDLDGGQDVVDVCNALNDGGYKLETILEITVTELKNQGHDIETIIGMIIGTVDQEEGATNAQLNDAKYLTKVLYAQGDDLGEICEGLLNTGFSLDEIASAFKKANMDLLETYTVLLNANGGQDSQTVIDALNKAGYEISTLFSIIVPDLLDKGHSLDDIITMLIGQISPEKGATSEQLKRINILAGEFITAGHSMEDVCVALADAGVSLEDNAKIVYGMSINFTEAYDLLLNAYGGTDVAGVAMAMIKANYDIDAVLDIVIPVFEDQGLTMSEIVGLLIGEVSPENGPTDFQLNMAAKLVEVFTGKGETLADVAEVLFAEGITLENIATILKGINVDFDEAYDILTNLGAGQDIFDIAFALINGGYDSKTVITTVVSVLKSQGYSNEEIIDAFIGTVDPEDGPTSAQKLYASFLVMEFQKAGDSLEDICADLATAGFTLQTIAPVLQSAEISAEDAFDVLLNFDGGQDAIDVALILISSYYAADEVFVLLVNNLKGQGHTVDEIIEMVIGDIDPEDGLTAEQLGYARDLAKAFQEIGDSLDVIATGFLNHGLTLKNTVSVFKLAEIEAADVYTVLMDVYEPEGDEVANRVITAAMISMSYDSFDVYSIAVEKLADEGITDEAEIVSILIGEIDPEDDQQISNAAKLSKVLTYNKDKLTAQNTVESFIDLFKNGYTFEQIAQMLIEGGVTQEQIDETFAQGFNSIVKELAKSGKSAWTIVSLLINEDNKADYIRPLAEQLRRNDFSIWTVRYAFYSQYYADNELVEQGIADAIDYKLIDTEEANTVNSMLDNGYTLTEVSKYFAEQGYQMSYITKLFKTLEQSLEGIFIALEETKTFYNSDLLVNDTAPIIILLDFYIDKDLFAVATKYYKDSGLNSEEIVLKLMSAKVKVDSIDVLADTIIGEYYKSITNLQTQSFVTLINLGFSIIWIKDTLIEKGISEEDIEAFIQNEDNFAAIYQGLRDVRVSASNIVMYFKVEESPGEYTVLLAENMIKDDMSEEEVREILLKYNADPDLIEEGILRGLA